MANVAVFDSVLMLGVGKGHVARSAAENVDTVRPPAGGMGCGHGEADNQGNEKGDHNIVAAHLTLR